MENNAHKLAELRINFRKQLPGAMEAIGHLAAQFFKQSFKQQGQIDGGLKPWKKRSFEWQGKSRAILVQRGRLRNNIRSGRRRMNSAAVVSDLPYSLIHNEGGQIPITPKMRRFFWAMYKESTKGLTKTKKGTIGKSKHNQKIMANAQIWRNLALTKKKHFNVPARPFMYHSADLNAKLDRYIDKFIKGL